MAIPNNVASIGTGATSSTIITAGHRKFRKLIVEGMNAGGTLLAETSKDGTTYRPLTAYSPAAVTPLLAVSFTTGSSNFILAFDSWLFDGMNYIRFTANAAIVSAVCTITME